jgi:hypothetical protein
MVARVFIRLDEEDTAHDERVTQELGKAVR